jgi:phospholipid:diacylglycerol acyltransferase
MSSFLRKRILGGPSREGTPPEKVEDVRLAPVSKLLKDHKGLQKGIKRRNGFIFFLGGLFGLVAAGFFAGRSDLIDFPDMGDLSMDSLMDILPAGFVTDARDLAVREISLS